MTAELNKSQLAAAPKVPPAPGTKPAAPPVNAPAAPATGSNISMLIMGGGIGIAALGSSVAFIAKSLQNVSFSTILAVLTGIIVIFGGPSVIMALIKLFNRDLSRFLESCGCAVNHPMRMSRKMGSIFTFVPSRPSGEISLVDPVNIFRPSRHLLRRWVIGILLILLLGGGIWAAWRYYFKPKYRPEPVCEKAETGKAEKVTVEKVAEKVAVEKKETLPEKEKVPAEKKKQ
jgi:hypothetical protein